MKLMLSKIWQPPTWKTCWFLVSLYFLALYFRAEPGILSAEASRAVAVSLGLFAPHLLVWLISHRQPKLENLLITALILLLLADPQTSPLNMLFLGFTTALIKTVIRYQGLPVFNPAAAGLLLASLWGVTTTWWGVSFAPRLPVFNMSIALLLTLPVGLYLLFLYKKLPTLISVPLATLFVYFWLTGDWPLVTLLEGTFAFFLLIMATEPHTTPLIDYQEWIYGLLLGTILALFFVFRLVGEPYLLALLILNGLFAAFRASNLLFTRKGV